VGAGPGDPELLTLKAVRVLSQCDVVLYDRLVNESILAHARTGAELIYVGKHQGEQEQTQQQIFRQILHYASQGKLIVRLKGGDPLVFGRGGEEWALAIEHGIDFELVPGVSSALAVPGLAGIPLTFRRLSQSFAVITGHCHLSSPREWSAYRDVDTLVFLMGVANREDIARGLIAGGRSGDEPVAFVQHGSLPQQRVIESTLAAVAAGSVLVANPAVFIIGSVVTLRDRLRSISDQIPRQPESEEPG
jgi:uroporphyrin-III C-methyltransferase